MKSIDHITISKRWRLYLDGTVCAHVWWIFFWSKCRTWTKNLKRNFSLTANWPLNQLCLLRYANDREAERWLKLPFNSTVHCLTFNTNWLQKKESYWFSELFPKSPSVTTNQLQPILLQIIFRSKYLSDIFWKEL